MNIEVKPFDSRLSFPLRIEEFVGRISKTRKLSPLSEDHGIDGHGCRIIAVCAMLFLFFESPVWRASLITSIAMMVVIMMIDTNANARIEIYKAKLQEAEQ